MLDALERSDSFSQAFQSGVQFREKRDPLEANSTSKEQVRPAVSFFSDIILFCLSDLFFSFSLFLFSLFLFFSFSLFSFFFPGPGGRF